MLNKYLDTKTHTNKHTYKRKYTHTPHIITNGLARTKHFSFTGSLISVNGARNCGVTRVQLAVRHHTQCCHNGKKSSEFNYVYNKMMNKIDVV